MVNSTEVGDSLLIPLSDSLSETLRDETAENRVRQERYFFMLENVVLLQNVQGNGQVFVRLSVSE